ncbi:MAG: hypothetical protein DWQ35_11780 [Planctomycetota bacterium]|nr:MAG: hypothetical protein DWQ35_11780 [Planctomycetota bacterium]
MDWFKTRMVSTFSVIALAMSSGVAAACPFCPTMVSQTLTQQIDTSDVAVLAELIDVPPKLDDSAEAPLFDEAIEASKAVFRVVKVYRGEEALGETREFKALYLSDRQPGEKFLILGRKMPEIEWGPPIWLGLAAQEYLEKLMALPSGEDQAHERLDFFEDYLQHEDTLLRADAFDEFARADYDTLKKIKDRIDRPRLLRWIADPEVTRLHRRLYFTMLGVCGTPEDAKLLEGMLREGTELHWQALDALVACYLTLMGEAGMPLIEELFLKKPDLEYVKLFAVTMALRFHGEEGGVIPRPRVVEAMRHVLERSDLADLVITDLARWEDWESTRRLVRLFYEADEDAFFIRMAVVRFMRVCPLPEAKTHMEAFAAYDPDVVKKATMTWPGLVPSKAVAENESAGAGEKASGADAATRDGDGTSPDDAAGQVSVPPDADSDRPLGESSAAAGGSVADAGDGLSRLIILATAAGCTVLLMLSFWVILRVRSEPAH